MPSHSRAVEVKLPEAVLLADLYEIAFDLESAERYCQKLVELQKVEPRDYFLEEGLMTTAVVKYGRCFTEGVRLSLKMEDLSELNANALSAHEYFIALRNKFIAHAVNAFEETYVTATATNKDGELLPIQDVHPGQHRILLTAESAPALMDLVRGVSSTIRKRISSEERKLLEHLRSLPIETIHQGDLHSPRIVEGHHVHQRRARGVHANKRTKS